MAAKNTLSFVDLVAQHNPQRPKPAVPAVPSATGTAKPRIDAPPTAAATTAATGAGTVANKVGGDALYRPETGKSLADLDKRPDVLTFMYHTGANSDQAIKAIQYGIWKNYTPENGWGEKSAQDIQIARQRGEWTPGDGSGFEWKYNDTTGAGQIMPYYRNWGEGDYLQPSWLVLSGNGGTPGKSTIIPAGYTKKEFENMARLNGASQEALDAFAQRFGYNTFQSLNWEWAVKEGRNNSRDPYRTFEGTYRRDPAEWGGDYAVRGAGYDIPSVIRADGTVVPLNEVPGNSYYGMTADQFKQKPKSSGLMSAAMGLFGQGGFGGTPTAYDLMTRYSAKDTPLMAQARGQALQIANSRGLMNSSIATQAGEEAALGTVLPLASQDADNAAQKERLGMELTSRERIALAQMGSQERLAQLDIASRERMQGNEIGYQTSERALDRSLQEQLAQWNLSSTDRDSAMKSVISMEQLYNQQYANIMANTSLSSEDRAAQLTAAKNLRDVQLDLIQQMYQISLDWGQSA